MSAVPGLNYRQFLFLAVDLAASTLVHFPTLAQASILEFNLCMVPNIIWSAAWCFWPNEVLEWYQWRTTHHSFRVICDQESIFTQFS